MKSFNCVVNSLRHANEQAAMVNVLEKDSRASDWAIEILNICQFFDAVHGGLGLSDGGFQKLLDILLLRDRTGIIAWS
jgi:hypothetical protein